MTTKTSAGKAVLNRADELRYFEALVCALLRRIGGSLMLPAAEIADGGNCYALHMRANHARNAVVLQARPAAERQ